jgi:MFS family permease
VTKQRYFVFLLMFLSISVNYMDRVNFAVSTPAIRQTFGFSLQQIGAILFAWSIIYALFNFPGGWLIDRLGLRRGLPFTLGWWSIFTIATPFASTLGAWYAIRGLMGAGEAAIWPLNAKCASAWAAPTRRSMFFTWAGSGQYVGPFVGNAIAGLILVRYGWQWTFILFGIAGLLVLPLWLLVVRDRPDSTTTNEKADWNGIRNVVCSRTGIGMLLVYLTFGYILFTFLNWVPSYMYYTFHTSILKSALWASLAAGFGWIGFIISGPFNDGLVAVFDRLTARRIGAVLPMLGAMACMAVSIFSARAGLAGATAVAIGLAQLLMNMTVGAWAVNVIDISPNHASTGSVYGIYNGVLNIMGALNSLILAWLATNYGFPAAFGSAIGFMFVFLVSMLFVVDRASYTKLIARARLEGAT